MTQWIHTGLPGTERVRRTMRRWSDGLGPRVIVLMYHRVAEVPCDPWDQCVTPAHFDAQLDILKQTVDVIPLADVHKAMGLEKLTYRAAAVTFDDGYADNLYAARSILKRHNLPATFFLTSGSLERRQEFWWDELERLFLYPGALPERLELAVSGHRWNWELGKEATYTSEDWERHRSWKAWDPPETGRQRLYLAVWNLLRPLPCQEQEQVLSTLFEWADLPRDPRPSHRVLTTAEAYRLASETDVEVGAHTVHHAALSSLPHGLQMDEVRSSKVDIEAAVRRRIRYFAYPYGDYSDETAAVVRDAGFSAALTTREGAVGLRGCRWHWPRCKVYDWDGPEFSRRLRTMLKINGSGRR